MKKTRFCKKKKREKIRKKKLVFSKCHANCSASSFRLLSLFRTKRIRNAALRGALAVSESALAASKEELALSFARQKEEIAASVHAERELGKQKLREVEAAAEAAAAEARAAAAAALARAESAVSSEREAFILARRHADACLRRVAEVEKVAKEERELREIAERRVAAAEAEEKQRC